MLFSTTSDITTIPNITTIEPRNAQSSPQFRCCHTPADTSPGWFRGSHEDLDVESLTSHASNEFRVQSVGSRDVDWELSGG